MILGGLFNYLNNVPYPLLGSDVFLCGVFLLLCVVPMAWIQWHFSNRFIYALLTTILICLFADLNDMPRVAALPLTIGVGGLAFFFRIETTKLCAAIMGVVLFWQCLSPLMWEEASVSWDTRLNGPPALLHVILDSYMGPDGLAARGEASRPAQLSIKQLAADYDLWVAPRAHARHPNTVNSLADILSLGKFPPPSTPMRTNHLVLPALPYLAALKEKDYAIHVVQTDFIDLCTHSDVASCRTVNRSNLSAMEAFGLPLADRVQVILANYFSLSGLTVLTADRAIKVAERLGYADRRPINLRAKLFSLTGADELGRLAREITSIGPGHAVIAHVLLPHDPYSFEENCTITPYSDWRYEAMEADWKQAQAAYERQLICANRKVADLIASFRQSPGGQNGIVIIHGDHGSRISKKGVEYRDGYAPSSEAIAAHYSALFAVSSRQLDKTSGSMRLRAVSGLLRSLVESDFTRTTPGGPNDGLIMLANEEWQPKQTIPINRSSNGASPVDEAASN